MRGPGGQSFPLLNFVQQNFNNNPRRETLRARGGAFTCGASASVSVLCGRPRGERRSRAAAGGGGRTAAAALQPQACAPEWGRGGLAACAGRRRGQECHDGDQRQCEHVVDDVLACGPVPGRAGRSSCSWAIEPSAARAASGHSVRRPRPPLLPARWRARAAVTRAACRGQLLRSQFFSCAPTQLELGLQRRQLISHLLLLQHGGLHPVLEMQMPRGGALPSKEAGLAWPTRSFSQLSF